MLILEALKPWRWLPGELGQDDVSKDWMLVVGATLFFPWTLFVWHRRVKSLAADYCNLDLANVLNTHFASQLASQKASSSEALPGHNVAEALQQEHLHSRYGAHVLRPNAWEAHTSDSRSLEFHLSNPHLPGCQSPLPQSPAFQLPAPQPSTHQTSSANLVITTSGFDAIVRPLVRQLPVDIIQSGQYQLIACRFWRGARDRARGKLAMLTAAIGKSVVAKAVCVTESVRDSPLLSAVATPCLVTWPKAASVPALSDVYLPLLYAEVVKHPGKDHLVRRVLLWHWAVVVIAYSVVSPHWFWNAIALLCLVFSYWSVYEIGYQENDVVGKRYEHSPKLSENYESHGDRLKLLGSPWPWLWAIGLALPGCALLLLSGLEGAWTDVGSQLASLMPRLMFAVGLWILFLVAIRTAFWVYNQFNEESRMLIYPLLQTQRLFAFTLLIQTTPVGFVLLMSLALSRWLQYCIYRCGGNRWKFPVNMSCLLVFVLLLTSVALSTPAPGAILGWQAAIALSFCVLKSFRKVAQVTSGFSLLEES